MKKVLYFMRSLLCVVFILLVFWVAWPASAQTTCECFCTGSVGVQSLGNTKATDCSAACVDRGENEVVCATGPASLPANSNTRCFTGDTCTQQGGVWGSEQARDCPGGMRYCYAPEVPVDLNIALGGVTKINNFGQYVNILYLFLLGASVAIAIVFLMIGGLQYAFGGVSAGAIEKAKERIRNALIGLVLLILAALLLETVNPQLRKLQTPQLPMVRRIELLSGDRSCEYLRDVAGYTLDSNVEQGSYAALGNNLCGSVARVLKTADGSDVSAGTTCTFSRCADVQKSCFGQGTNARCVSCEEIVAGNDFGIAPSSRVCSALQQKDRVVEQNGTTKTITKNYCFWTRESDLVVNGLDITLAVPLTFSPAALVGLGVSANEARKIIGGTCAAAQIDCNRITSCRGYDDIIVRNENENACLDDVDPLFGGDLTLRDVCVADPCGAAPSGQTCGIYENNGSTDCANSVFLQKIAEIRVPELAEKIPKDPRTGATPNVLDYIARKVRDGSLNSLDAAAFYVQYTAALSYVVDRDGAKVTASDSCAFQ